LGPSALVTPAAAWYLTLRIVVVYQTHLDVLVENFKTMNALHLSYCSFVIIPIFLMSINSDIMQESDTHKSLLASFKPVNNNLHRPQWHRSHFSRFTRFQFCYENWYTLTTTIQPSLLYKLQPPNPLPSNNIHLHSICYYAMTSVLFIFYLKVRFKVHQYLCPSIVVFWAA